LERFRSLPLLPDAAVDSIPLASVVKSVLRRLCGRSKHALRHDGRFVIDEIMSGGSVRVTDRMTGKTLNVRTPSQYDAFTVLEVFTERAYSLRGTAYERAAEAFGCSDHREKGGKPLIIDAGANIGASSLALSMLYPEALIVAIEPDPRNLRLIEDNCRERPSIQVRNAALGFADGKAGFETSTNPRSGRLGEGDQRKLVEVVSVPTLLAQYQSHVPFILKMDIEGGEQECFSHPCDWVDHFPVIIVEPHDWKWPGSHPIGPFLEQISKRHRDLLVLGENLVSIDSSLLAV
jgi:FkbM family methyltransferase